MRTKPLLGIEIAGYGSALPDLRESNQEFIDRIGVVGKTPEDIERVTGIKYRHRAEGLADDNAQLAAKAGRIALERAELEPYQIDSVILATTTPDQRVPATSARVSHLLGLEGAAGFDVNAACSGFTYALNEGYRRIHCGDQHSLVIGCDVLSRLINDDPDEWKTSVLFGDGAGAVVLSQTDTRPEAGLLGWNEVVDGSLVDILCADYDTPIYMQGREVFLRAIRLMPEVGNKALQAAGVSPDEIKAVIPHQANLRILKSAAKDLGISMDKMVWTGDMHANTSSASIPMALAQTLDEGRVERGDAALLVGFGAGMTAAASVVRY